MLPFLLQASSSNSKDVVIDMNEEVSLEKMSMRAPYETTKVLQPSANDRKFNQDLRYEGKRLVLRTGFIASADIKISENEYGKQIMIPVSPWLRKQLDTIEAYITLNMTVPSEIAQTWQPRDAHDIAYKKVWDGDTLYISISNWCQFYRQDDGYLSEVQYGELGDGSYSVCITIPGVYFGHHGNNKVASLTMRVQQLLFKPEPDNVDSIIDAILERDVGVKHGKRRRKAKA